MTTHVTWRSDEVLRPVEAPVSAERMFPCFHEGSTCLPSFMPWLWSSITICFLLLAHRYLIFYLWSRVTIVFVIEKTDDSLHAVPLPTYPSALTAYAFLRWSTSVRKDPAAFPIGKHKAPYLQYDCSSLIMIYKAGTTASTRWLKAKISQLQCKS